MLFWIIHEKKIHVSVVFWQRKEVAFSCLGRATSHGHEIFEIMEKVNKERILMFKTSMFLLIWKNTFNCMSLKLYMYFK